MDTKTTKHEAVALTAEEACQCDTGKRESQHVFKVLAASLLLSLAAFAAIYWFWA